MTRLVLPTLEGVFRASVTTVEWVAAFAARCRDELDWTPSVVDFGGGLGLILLIVILVLLFGGFSHTYY
jgi:hypothetical protein